MKKTLLFAVVSLFALSASAQAAPGAREIWNQLTKETHALAWADRPATDADRAAIFSALVDIFRNPSRYVAGETPTDREVRAVILALKESGKFATDSEGRLLPVASEFYAMAVRRAQENPGHFPLQSALAESLAHTGTPEGVDAIAGLLTDGNVANFYLLRELDQLYGGAAGVAIDEGLEAKPYHPNTGVPLHERKRKQAWLAAYAKALPEVESVLRSGSADPRTRGMAEKFLSRQASLGNEAAGSRKVASLPETRAGMEEPGVVRASLERAPAEENGSRSLPGIALGLLALLGFAGIALRLRRR